MEETKAIQTIEETANNMLGRVLNDAMKTDDYLKVSVGIAYIYKGKYEAHEEVLSIVVKADREPGSFAIIKYYLNDDAKWAFDYMSTTGGKHIQFPHAAEAFMLDHQLKDMVNDLGHILRSANQSKAK